MANYCSNYLTIICPGVKKAEELHAKITNKDPELIKLFAWFDGNDFYGLVDGTLSIEMDVIRLTYGSKWSPPEESLVALSEAFPGYQFENLYEEPGNGAYGILYYQNGENTVDTTYDEFNYMVEYGPEDFREDIKAIKTLPYDKFIEEFLLWKPCEDSPYHYIQPLVAERIRVEDVVKFMGMDWNEEAREILAKKCKE